MATALEKMNKQTHKQAILLSDYSPADTGGLAGGEAETHR